jgi:CheY-like chemotaxis protein
MTYVLLIQDDEVRNRAVAGLLTARGFFVTTVRSAQEALEQTRSSGARPSVIILDLTSTRARAGAFLDAQATEPLLRDVPVILETTEAEPAEPMPATVAAVLRHPMPTGDLLMAIEWCTNR